MNGCPRHRTILGNRYGDLKAAITALEKSEAGTAARARAGDRVAQAKVHLERSKSDAGECEACQARMAP